MAKDLDVEWRMQIQHLTTEGGTREDIARNAVATVVHANRKCGEWRKWNPLRSAKEHEDMDLLSQMMLIQTQTAASTQQAAISAQQAAASAKWSNWIAIIATLVATGVTVWQILAR